MKFWISQTFLPLSQRDVKCRYIEKHQFRKNLLYLPILTVILVQHCTDTVGLDSEIIRKYNKYQEAKDLR